MQVFRNAQEAVEQLSNVTNIPVQFLVISNQITFICLCTVDRLPCYGAG
jgi:hypothetical protein